MGGQGKGEGRRGNKKGSVEMVWGGGCWRHFKIFKKWAKRESSKNNLRQKKSEEDITFEQNIQTFQNFNKKPPEKI